MLEYDIKLLTKPQPDRKRRAGGGRYCWPNVKLIDFAGIQSTGHPSPSTRCLFCTENVEVFSTRPRFSLHFFFFCCIFVVSVGITKILTKRFLLLIIILIILNKQLIMQSSLREFAEGNKEVRVKRVREGGVLA